jgi:hypothetical protein
MSAICEQAAAESSWLRWCDQALAIVADRPEPPSRPLPAVLWVVEPQRDSLVAPLSGHPAARALERGRPS